MELEGKVALITGAGSGIGYAIAECFGAEGASVVINYLGYADDAKQLAQKLTQGGHHSVAIEADVSNQGQVNAMVQQAVEQLGTIDILVNNAGIESSAPLLDVTEESWDKMLSVDLKGAFLCLQACGRIMKQHNKGSIVNISSIHEDLAFPGFAPYCAAKGGMRMLMRDAAVELAQYTIRVNDIAPGAIATPINKKTMADPEKMAALKQLIPLGRMGTPNEVAQVALFLASDRASYVTGSTYYVDGGMLRQAKAL